MRNEFWNEQTNPEGRWRKYSYEQIVARDKTSIDIFWLKDKSLADLDNLPEPDELALDIIENLEVGLASFRAVAIALSLLVCKVWSQYAYATGPFYLPEIYEELQI